MRDYLLDIVKHTLPLGAFNALRVDGSDNSTEISATESERHLVLKAKLSNSLSDFKGTFGIPNINLLNTILNIPEYQEDAHIEMCYKDDEKKIPYNIHFENKGKDFTNDFRLIGEKVIDTMEPKINLMVDKWPVQFEPAMTAMQKYKYQLSANPDEQTAEFAVNNGEVTVALGDGQSHSGGFVFHSGIDEKLKYKISVSSLYAAGIFAMSGDKTINIGDFGMMINVDSGIASYNYILPNISK